MIAELGNYCLILALAVAGAQSYFSLLGAHRQDAAFMSVSRPMVMAQLVLVTMAFLLLVNLFLQNDFSVLYVASNSNSELPTMYRVAAVWGAHEGSLVLWMLIQSLWMAAVAIRSRNLPPGFSSRVLGVLGLLSIGFLLFILLTSNPFDRLFPPAMDGRDLNPLLQDPALAIHPPLLYTGYVGFSVAFAFAIAALLQGKLDQRWARWTRPWTTAAWMFLTIGIALGSWWAYYELGWGGWWMWDPVENASFMPWLVGTALIHSLAVTEKRGTFKSWTLLLAICAFSLSLLGTFLVRSGVLVSVHSFASDPARGAFILAFLVVVVGSSLVLYAMRAGSLESSAGFKLVSRETALLVNNILLVIAAILILIGTLYPLFLDAFNLPSISVGEPYYLYSFLLCTLPLVVLMGVGQHLPWKRVDGAKVLPRLRIPLIVALVLGLLVSLVGYGGGSVLSVVGVVTAFWVMATALLDPVTRLVSGNLKGITRGHWGMILAHLGVGVFVLGATVVSAYDVDQDLALGRGETVDLAGHTFMFQGVQPVEGPNYSAIEGTLLISEGIEPVARLTPQKRTYRVQQSPMTESSIDSTFMRDIYVALGDPLGGGKWSMRLQFKPLVFLLWLGSLLMFLGGMIAITDKRYRVASATAKQPTASGEEAVASAS
ncbi:MAG: heme lyase CcmF/NrfE family subunit [Pseudomonadota bacterium]